MNETTENAGVAMNDIASLAPVTVGSKIFDARRKVRNVTRQTNASNRVFHDLSAVHAICSSFY